jgi:hypothetical protein
MANLEASWKSTAKGRMKISISLSGFIAIHHPEVSKMAIVQTKELSKRGIERGMVKLVSVASLASL